jgi:hypothetical protein
LGVAQQIADHGVAAFLHEIYESPCQSGAADETIADAVVLISVGERK